MRLKLNQAALDCCHRAGARSGVAAEPRRSDHAVAGDHDRERISPKRLADSTTKRVSAAEFMRNPEIGPRFAKWHMTGRIPNVALKRRAVPNGKCIEA
jgi:hypothetical protein